MSSARGWRKWSVIIVALIPTLLGITLVNIFPLIYSVRISFTDLNQKSRLDPVTRLRIFKDVGMDNYTKLFGDLFTLRAGQAMLTLLVIALPLIACYILIRRMKRRNPFLTPDTGMYWLGAIALTVILWFVLDGNGELAYLSDTGSFFIVILRSVVYVILCMPLFLVVGLTLALILNNPRIRFKAVWRTLLIIPWAVPSYITALIWQYFFRGDQGTINQILKAFGVQDPPFWLKDPLLAFLAIVIVNVWLSYPFFMTIILAALQSIPGDMYEAAEVDGASKWLQLRKITIPMLRPAVLPAVVLSSITTFQMFNTVFLITGGDPTRGAGKPGATDLVMVYAYRQVFQEGNYGKMGAFAVIVFVILLGATLLSLRVTNVTRGAYE